jgi:hypothetical protein
MQTTRIKIAGEPVMLAELENGYWRWSVELPEGIISAQASSLPDAYLDARKLIEKNKEQKS